MFDYVALIMLFFYSLNLLLGSSQLAQMFEPRNTPWTNRNGILGFLTFSSLLRVIFWIIVAVGKGNSTDLDQLVGLVFALPLWLNFAGLSLLALFYADSLGLFTTKDPLYVWCFVNAIFFTLCISLAFIQSQRGIDSSQQYDLSIVYVIYATVLDVVLASALGYFGFKFTAASPDESIKKKLLPRKRKTFIFVNGVIVVMYLLRAIFTAVFAIPDLVPASKTTIDYSRGHGMTPGVAFAFFMLTEVVVVFCVFVLLWKTSIPRSNIVLLTGKSGDVGDTMDENGVWRTTESGTVVGATQNPLTNLEARLLSEEDNKVQVIYNEAPPSPLSNNTAPSQSSTWWDSVVNGVVEPLNSSAFMRSMTSSMGSSGSSPDLHLQSGTAPTPSPAIPSNSSSEFVMFRDAVQPKEQKAKPRTSTQSSIASRGSGRDLRQSNQSSTKELEFPRSSACAYDYPPMSAANPKSAGVEPMSAALATPNVNNANNQSETDAIATPPLWVHGNKPLLHRSHSSNEDNDSSPDVTVGGMSTLQRFHHPDSNLIPKSHKKAASLHDPALLSSVQTPPMQRSANSMHNVPSISVIEDQSPNSLRDSLYNKDYHNSYNKTVGPWDILKRK